MTPLVCPFCKKERNIAADIEVNGERRYRCLTCNKTFFHNKQASTPPTPANLDVLAQLTALRIEHIKRLQSELKTQLAKRSDPNSLRDPEEWIIETSSLEQISTQLMKWAKELNNESVSTAIVEISLYLDELNKMNKVVFSE